MRIGSWRDRRHLQRLSLSVSIVPSSLESEFVYQFMQEPFNFRFTKTLVSEKPALREYVLGLDVG